MRMFGDETQRALERRANVVVAQHAAAEAGIFANLWPPPDLRATHASVRLALIGFARTIVGPRLRVVTAIPPRLPVASAPGAGIHALAGAPSARPRVVLASLRVRTSHCVRTLRVGSADYGAVRWQRRHWSWNWS